MKRKLSVILMQQSLMLWNWSLQSSRSVKERKRLIFPGFRSDGLTIICPKRNWKRNSVSGDGSSYRMPFPENIISYLRRQKWKNITSVCMPAKQMNTWWKQTIQRRYCMGVWYHHLWVLRSSMENMWTQFLSIDWSRNSSVMVCRSQGRTWQTGAYV